MLPDSSVSWRPVPYTLFYKCIRKYILFYTSAIFFISVGVVFDPFPTRAALQLVFPKGINILLVIKPKWIKNTTNLFMK